MRPIFVSVFSLFCTSLFWGQSKNFLDVPYLETSARVDTLVVPDKIYLSITITEKDSRGRKSVEEQENKMAQSFRALGIDLDSQLFIKDLGSNFKKYFLRQKDVLKRKRYSLLVHSGKKAGEILVELEKLDIANVYLEKTEYSKMDALELELKGKAIEKAKKKAEALTKPLGQQVGSAIHIMDNSTPHYPRYQALRMGMQEMKMEEAQPLDIDFEQIKIDTSVNVKFKITK